MENLLLLPQPAMKTRELGGGADGEEKQNAAVDRERRHVPAVGNDAERENRRRGDHDRREEMHHLVRARRHDVFLDQHLDAIRHRLEQAERADAIWPVTVLDAGENFPLQHRHESEEREKHGEQRGDIEQAGNDLDEPVRRPAKEGEDPLLRENKNLVEKTAHLAWKKSEV